MHAYLNDPTGIRDAGVAEPTSGPSELDSLPGVRALQRKGAATSTRGCKEIAAVFVVGRFDRFVEKAQEQCAGAAYAPFPELQKLSR